ncbi:hypothetical protein [Tautonia marina]|uniref:hypothetical protein n=1 Tax=Tautonia marina TaxID=2653855 RepID=UPI0012610053|nr:hypothetical protein [Tautonia marina]
MPTPREGLPPRPGPHRQSTDLGRKVRHFPIGSTRSRLWCMLRPPTFDDHVLGWLGITSPHWFPDRPALRGNRKSRPH